MAPQTDPIRKEATPPERAGATVQGAEALAAAHRLYQATLELFTGSDDPARDRHRLTGPLSQVVARQKTRVGQADCAELAAALAKGDPGGALDACRRLIELEGALEAQSRRRKPPH